MQVFRTVLKDRFGWSYDLDCEYNPKAIGWRAWYAWVHLRLRKPREGGPQSDKRDFLYAGVFMNSCHTCPKVFRRELFTGIHIGLFEHDLHIGRWRHVDKYSFENWPRRDTHVQDPS